MQTLKQSVDAEGLMSYGPSTSDNWRSASTYVDKTFKGTNYPDDQPMEQPSKFELAVNLKTAKALRMTIPQTLRTRADEVIE